MKHTKNMVYKQTDSSEALYICTINDGDLYRQTITPIIESMKKRYQRGTFDREKAADAFYPVATEEARRLHQQFGEVYSVTDRYTCAIDMVDRYMENITE